MANISQAKKRVLGAPEVQNFPKTQYAKIKEIIDRLNTIVTTVGTLKGDIISEYTSNTGVTVDNVLIKDGLVYAPSVYSTVTADGAITIPAYNKTFYITKAGVAAMTLADPTATTHDGVTLTFVATTANAHTLSNAAGSGFNAGGAASDIGTFGGAKGDNIVVTAYQGKWYVVSKVNVTLA